MFVKPRAKPSLVPPKKKRKIVSAIEEITFDPTAREDYLTGFHKRKLQRIKNAQEEAAKRERQDKLAARKALRESRKADLEKHVEAVNSILREQNEVRSESSEPETETRTESWEGIAEEVVDHEDEYIDDDRFTTVTIEAVDVSKDGLHKIRQDEGEDSDASNAGKSQETSNRAVKDHATEVKVAKRRRNGEQSKGVKKKKKAFRYESKAERKATRFKERSGNKAKAKVRRST